MLYFCKINYQYLTKQDEKTMHSIKKCIYGLEVKFIDVKNLSPEQLRHCFKEVRDKLQGWKGIVNFYCDFTGVDKLTQAVLNELLEQKLFISENYEAKRWVYLIDSLVLSMQIKRVSKELGLMKNERVVSIKNCDDWEDKALGWLINSQEPVRKERKW